MRRLLQRLFGPPPFPPPFHFDDRPPYHLDADEFEQWLNDCAAAHEIELRKALLDFNKWAIRGQQRLLVLWALLLAWDVFWLLHMHTRGLVLFNAALLVFAAINAALCILQLRRLAAEREEYLGKR